MLEIMAYTKFKNKAEYKKYYTNVEINMMQLGFTPLGWIEWDKGDKSVEIAKEQCEARGLKSGLAVWYRTNGGQWGFPFIQIFHRTTANKKAK